MSDFVVNALGQPVGRPLPQWRAAKIPSREPMPGRFCRLERLDAAAHADALHTVFGEDVAVRMWTYLPYGPFDSAAAYREWIEAVTAREDPLFFAILDPAGAQPLGVSSYLRVDAANGSIEVGHLAFSPRLQRTAAATEAMFLMIDRAFSWGYRRCEWKCDSLNEPSRIAAARLGFTCEGLFRQAVVVKGRSRDTAWYSIVDGEWAGLRAAHRRWLDASNFDSRGLQKERLSALTAAVARVGVGCAEVPLSFPGSEGQSGDATHQACDPKQGHGTGTRQARPHEAV